MNDKTPPSFSIKKPTTIIGLMAISAIIIVAIFYLVGQGPKPIFDFDDGTVQGWTANGIFDDTGIKYDGKLYKIGHGEQHQYPNKFPCPPNCDPLNDKKGSLAIGIADLQPSLPNPPFNFPNNSEYWQIDLISPNLTSLFQNKTEFEAYIGDMFGVDPDHVKSVLLLNITTGGVSSIIPPTGGMVYQTVSKDSWTKIFGNFTIPSGGYIQNIIIRIRGDWKSYKVYEGAIFVDHVSAVK